MSFLILFCSFIPFFLKGIRVPITTWLPRPNTTFIQVERHPSTPAVKWQTFGHICGYKFAGLVTPPLSFFTVLCSTLASCRMISGYT